MLATLIQTIANGEPAFIARRISRAVISYAVAGIALAIGAGFLIAAAYMVAAARFGPLETTLGFGIGFIVIAGITLIVHRIRSGMIAKRRAAEAKASQLKTLAGITAISLLPRLLKGRGGLLEIAAPVIALAAYAIFKENAGDGKSDKDRTGR